VHFFCDMCVKVHYMNILAKFYLRSSEMHKIFVKYSVFPFDLCKTENLYLFV